jgi:hypothetical protein
MPAPRNAYKVGLVTLAVTFAAFCILLWISKGVSGEMRRITVRFESSPAMPTLAIGSDVFVGGQRVGKVRGVSLAEGPVVVKDGKSRPTLDVVVEADILAFIEPRADCKVFAEGPPLGGDGIIKIDLGKSPEPLPHDQAIRGADPGGFAAILAGLQTELDGSNATGLLGMIKSQLDGESEATLMGKLLRSMGDINAMTASLARELSPEQKATLLAKLHEVADHINDTTGSLRNEFASQSSDVLLGKIHLAVGSINQMLDTMARMVKTNEQPINNTMKSVERTAANIADEMDPANLDGLMAQFKQAGASLNASLDDIHAVTGATRQVIVLNRDNLSRMLINFKEASDHLKSGFKYVLRHPWRLMKAPGESEIRQQAIFDAARSFAEAATRVDDAMAQIKALAELNNGSIPADHPELLRIQADLQQTQQNYRKAEDQLWKQLGVVSN